MRSSNPLVLIDNEKGLREHFWDTYSNRLAIVIPFTMHDSDKVRKRISSWSEIGPACKYSFQSNHTKLIDIIFWFHLDLQANPELVEQLNMLVSSELAFMRHCFANVKFLSAHLRSDEDTYPGGVSIMWYKLFLENVSGFTGHYDYMFWMEHDVQPIRPLWIDKLYLEISTPEFFIKGSVFRGRYLDKYFNDRRLIPQIPHINGNALFRVGSEEFNHLIRAARLQYPPEKDWNPMDTSLFLTLMNFSSRWSQFQSYIHKIVYSDFIQNWSVDYTENIGQNIYEKDATTFFIHGDGHSAADRVSPRTTSKALKSKFFR